MKIIFHGTYWSDQVYIKPYTTHYYLKLLKDKQTSSLNENHHERDFESIKTTNDIIKPETEQGLKIFNNSNNAIMMNDWGYFRLLEKRRYLK